MRNPASRPRIIPFLLSIVVYFLLGLVEARAYVPSHTYGYDLVGNRTSTIYGRTGRSISSNYDALNRLTSMTEERAFSKLPRSFWHKDFKDLQLYE